MRTRIGIGIQQVACILIIFFISVNSNVRIMGITVFRVWLAAMHRNLIS